MVCNKYEQNEWNIEIGKEKIRKVMTSVIYEVIL